VVNFVYLTSFFFHRIVFTFDPEEVKTMTQDILDKNLDSKHQRPMSSTDIMFDRGVGSKEWRYSAPSGGDRKRNRDSMGSIDYLSDAGGEFCVGSTDLGKESYSHLLFWVLEWWWMHPPQL